jgi:hypothetical protein
MQLEILSVRHSETIGSSIKLAAGGYGDQPGNQGSIVRFVQ